MGNSKTLWSHEEHEADALAHRLLGRDPNPLPGCSALSAKRFLNRFQHGQKLKRTRDNLLFTRQLAFDTACKFFQGEDRHTQLRLIAAKTKAMLDQERKGLYTDKIRRKQMREISLLIEHYLDLLTTGEKSYPRMVRAAYQTAEKYRSFLNKLEQAEHEVIQTSIKAVRRGSKTERLRWFEKVKRLSQEARQDELATIFGA